MVPVRLKSPAAVSVKPSSLLKKSVPLALQADSSVGISCLHPPFINSCSSAGFLDSRSSANSSTFSSEDPETASLDSAAAALVAVVAFSAMFFCISACASACASVLGSGLAGAESEGGGGLGNCGEMHARPSVVIRPPPPAPPLGSSSVVFTALAKYSALSEPHISENTAH